MSELKQILMQRDRLTPSEADEQIEVAKQRIREGEDPAEVLQEEFGLEPDYFYDLVDTPGDHNHG